MKILIACEYSGKMREAFRRKGFDAWSCDLYEPADDDSLFHVNDDAARHAVVGQIEAVRTAQIGGRCSLCGHRLLSDTHVDHAPPFTFEVILQDWLRTVGEVRVADAGPHSVFADDEQRDDWRQWHAWWADLRLIHAHENLGAKR